MNTHTQPNLVRGAVTILHCGLPAVAAALIGCCFYITSLTAYDAARLYPIFTQMIEHILMSLLLIVGGALLYDLAWREKSEG